MSDQIKAQISELLIDLSEKEQEIVSGGGLPSYNFFLQLTNISSSAESQISVGGTSSRQKAAYTFKQLTLGLNFSSRGSKRRRGRSQSWSNTDLLYFVLMSLFY